MNDSLSSDHSSVCYATTQDAIHHIKTFGPGCFLAKTDIKNAFQIVPVRPQDYNLLGMRWNEAYFYDCYMPMGRSSSCRTFETFSTALEWIASSQLSISHIIHLLDDFLITAPTHALCQNQLNLLLDLCSYLNDPIAPDKTLGPSTRGLSNTHK